MTHCTRANTIVLGDGYSLLTQNDYAALPTPKAHLFTLADDKLHYAPDRPADVLHVKLDITLDFEQETVSGTAYTTFRTLYEEIRTISLDAVELAIEQVTIMDGKELPYTLGEKKLTIPLDRTYRRDEEFTIAVKYSAKPRTGLHFIKPAPEDPTRPTQVYTYGQPRYYSHWFPCHDAPNERATTELIVTVPAQFLTVSNGTLLEVIDNGTTKTHHWRLDFPHAVYLMSLVVGDFAVIEDTYKGKPVTYYIRKDRKDDAPLYMSKTPEMMRFYSEYTGIDYPYDNYDQTIVELFTGAMEHTTATTHGFSLVPDKRASLDIDLVPIVAHELAHQWFGNLVTCRDWSNGWLNEGFATYFELLWCEHDRGRDEFKQAMLNEKLFYLEEDSSYRRPVVYYVYHDHGFELFDCHLYSKGGWVLHMLRHQLGEANFQRAIQAYLQRFRGKEVITADLERTLEEVTGHSLARFFQQWIYSGGYPALDVTYLWDNEQHMLRLTIKQTQKVDDLTPCFVTPIDLAFTLPTTDTTPKVVSTPEVRTVSMRLILGEDDQTEQTFFFPFEAEPVMIRVDPDGWLLKTLKFARPSHMLRYQLAHDPDVLGRIEAAEALSEKSEEKNLQALVTALNTDAFWGVRAAAAAALGSIGTAHAQTALIDALHTLDPVQFSRVRAAIAKALGHFQAPQQEELAQRSATALRAILETGDVSYQVEAAAAGALGKTHIKNNAAILIKQLEKPSWIHYVQRGIFRGMAASGENSVVDTMANYLNNIQNHPTLRLAATTGFVTLGQFFHLYSEEARQRAVTALCHAVEHDSWGPVRGLAAHALMKLGEKRAIGPLERAASRELHSGWQYQMRIAAHVLRTREKHEEHIEQFRKELDELRAENRKLKEQLDTLVAKLS